MKFSRNRGGSGRHARDDSRGAGDPVADAVVDDAPATADRGPYDIGDAPAGVQRLDLGSLHIPAVDGVEVRVQANPDGGVEQVILVHGNSSLQLGVFAAPRSEGIWDDVRGELRAALAGDGAAVEEAVGDYGPELRARVRTPDGPTDIRFVGVDGPRWMVRAVFQGPAAVDPARGGPLWESLAGLVVDRGKEAKPVTEPLPLRLPREAAEQMQRDAAQAAAQQAAAEARGGEPPQLDFGGSSNGSADDGSGPRRSPRPRGRS